MNQPASAQESTDKGYERFMKFALAFLILFVLLWLFAPDPDRES